MTKREFAEVFIPTMTYYNGKNVEDSTITLYYNALCDIDVKIFKEAVTRIIKTMKFFPKVSEILEIINGDETDKKAMAWEFVINNLCNATKITDSYQAPEGTHETISRMGGWFRAAQWKEDELTFRKRDFFELFTCESTMPLLNFNKKLGLELKIIPSLNGEPNERRERTG